MKKLLFAIGAIFALAIVGQILTVSAAPYPTGIGGTGTSATPQSGQVLIGNGSGSYTPAYILCAGTCQVSTSSGGITITGTGVATNTGDWGGTWQLFNPSDFLPSSTVKVTSVNGLSGVVTITSSSLGVVWPTVNGNKSANYNIAAGTGATSTISGATTTLSVSLNNGNTQTCSASQFVNQVTSGGIVSCGSVSIPTYTFSAGTGISTSQSTSTTNTTTTITLNINNGSVQNCTTGQWVNQLSSTGIVSCGVSINTINGVNTSTITFIAGSGMQITTTTNSITFTNTGSGVSTSTANTWTALQTFTQGITANGAVTLPSSTSAILVTNSSGQVAGFAGSNCSAGNAPTGISATGTVMNCTAYLSGNQSVTLTISGDATGTASGATSISDSIQVTGLLGKSLPSLATGTLEYINGAWTLGNIPNNTFVAGSGLTVSQATSTTNTTTTYTLNIGTGCSGSNFVQTISPTGTITCAVPSGGASSTNVYGANGVTVVQVGINATATLNTAYAAIWSALETFNAGLTANGTTTLASTTNSLLVTNGSGTVLAYAGSNPCGANQFATGISATGTISCANGVTSVNGSNGAVTITSSSLGVIYNPNWLTAAIQSINTATSSAQTIVGGTGESVATVAGTSNSTTTITNTGVTSFTGQGCVTAANSTGTVALSVTCISGNQNITFTIGGDATGTGSGTTAITDNITVTGLNGKALPTLATGTLEYSGGAWKIDLATSSLGVYDANGNLSSYIGSNCSGGQFVTGFSATGTVACGTPSSSGGLASTTPFTSGGIAYDNSGSISASSTSQILPNGGISTQTLNVTSTSSFGGQETTNGGITNTGNVTTTNETVSSTLALMNVTPSGTIVYPVG